MENTELAITLLLDVLARANSIGALINKARSEKRDVTGDELVALASQDDAARGKLQAAIDAAR